MAWNRLHEQTGTTDMADPTNTQTDTGTKVLPDNPYRTAVTVTCIPITSGGAVVTGTDRGLFTVKLWTVDQDANGVEYYTNTQSVTLSGGDHAIERDMPPGVRLGVSVSSIVLPAGAAGFRILTRDHA